MVLWVAFVEIHLACLTWTGHLTSLKKSKKQRVRWTALRSVETTFKSRKPNDEMEAGNQHSGLWLFSGGDDDMLIGSPYFRKSQAVARSRICMAGSMCPVRHARRDHCHFQGQAPTRSARSYYWKLYITYTAVKLETEGEMWVITRVNLAESPWKEKKLHH